MNYINIKRDRDYLVTKSLGNIDPNISKFKLDRAIKNEYKLIGLWENNEFLAMAELYVYPHLTDEKLA